LVGQSWRFLLQRVGTEVGRSCHPDLWVQLAIRSQKEWAGKINLIVFDDVRFENEARQCNLLIELRRQGIDYAKRHASNMGLPESIHRVVVVVAHDAPGNAAEYIIDMAMGMAIALGHK
jgi:hypothetical protein